jgi:hypothetical protein
LLIQRRWLLPKRLRLSSRGDGPARMHGCRRLSIGGERRSCLKGTCDQFPKHNFPINLLTSKKSYKLIEIPRLVSNMLFEGAAMRIYKYFGVITLLQYALSFCVELTALNTSLQNTFRIAED